MKVVIPAQQEEKEEEKALPMAWWWPQLKGETWWKRLRARVVLAQSSGKSHSG